MILLKPIETKDAYQQFVIESEAKVDEKKSSIVTSFKDLNETSIIDSELLTSVYDKMLCFFKPGIKEDSFKCILKHEEKKDVFVSAIWKSRERKKNSSTNCVISSASYSAFRKHLVSVHKIVMNELETFECYYDGTVKIIFDSIVSFFVNNKNSK